MHVILPLIGNRCVINYLAVNFYTARLDSAFHLSEANQMSARYPGDLVNCLLEVVLQLNIILEKRPHIF